jgi:hypothetical protein
MGQIDGKGMLLLIADFLEILKVLKPQKYYG